MNKREKFLKEIAEVINRNSMEAYFNPEFPVNGKPAPVCLALKMIKGGTEYTNPRGTQPHFRCSNGRYEIGISN